MGTRPAARLLTLRWLAVAAVFAATTPLAVCAHAPLAHVDLSGWWQGDCVWTTRVPEGYAPPPDVPIVVTLELVDRGGRVSGTGTVTLPERPYHVVRDLDVSGSVRQGQVRLVLAHKGSSGAWRFKGGVSRADRLTGYLDDERALRGLIWRNPHPIAFFRQDSVEVGR